MTRLLPKRKSSTRYIKYNPCLDDTLENVLFYMIVRHVSTTGCIKKPELYSVAGRGFRLDSKFVDTGLDILSKKGLLKIVKGKVILKGRISERL